METLITTVTKPKPTLWNKYFILLCIASTLIFMAMYLFIGVVPIYVDHLGGTAAFSGLLTTAATAASMVSRLFVGRLSDSRGRRNILVAGALLFTVSTFAYPLFPFLGALVVLRIIQGISQSATSTSSAAVADVIPKERLSEGVGFHGVGMAIASAIGPTLSMTIIAGGRFNPLFIIVALLLLAATVIFFFVNYEKSRERPSKAGNVNISEKDDLPFIWRFIEKKAIPPALTQFIMQFGFASIFSFFMLYVEKKGIPYGTLFFTSSAVMVLAARLSAGRIADKKGTIWVVMPALFCGAASLILLLVSKNILTFLAAGVLYGICHGTVMPSLNASAIKRSPAARRGVAGSTFFIFGDIGLGAGSAFWGAVLDVSGFTAVYIGSAVFLILALISAFFTCRDKERAITASDQ